MRTRELKKLFRKYEEEYLEFDRIERSCFKRPDLHAFLLLDELVPGDRDILAGARHDEVFLDVEIKDLAAAATEEQVVELIRCGVRLDEDTESLMMFV